METEGLYIQRDNSIGLQKGMSSGGLALLAKAGGLEVMRQRIDESAQIWISPADDKETVEFFYIVKGSMSCKLQEQTLTLKSGDSFYVEALKEEVLFNANEPVELLYITNAPVFDSIFGFQDDLFNLIHRINDKDNYTLRHSWDVMEYSVKLVEVLDLANEIQMDNIVFASLFHDVGKCLVPDEVLKSKKALTPSEARLIMRHPIDGGRLLKPHYSERIVEIVKNHHERLDGSGYPYGLMAEEISREAKIVAVADAFDAMTTDRGYNRVMEYSEAAEELAGLADKFDNDTANALLMLARDGTVDKLRKKVEGKLSGAEARKAEATVMESLSGK